MAGLGRIILIIDPGDLRWRGDHTLDGGYLLQAFGRGRNGGSTARVATLKFSRDFVTDAIASGVVGMGDRGLELFTIEHLIALLDGDGEE